MLIFQLLRRDLLLVKKQLAFVLVYTVVMTAFLAGGISVPGSGLQAGQRAPGALTGAGLALISALLLLLGLFTQEEKNPEAAALLCAAPYPRWAFVLARYLLMGLVVLWEFLLCAVCFALAPQAQAPAAPETALAAALCAAGISLVLPLVYRFGAARMRWLLMLVVVAAVMAVPLSARAGVSFSPPAGLLDALLPVFTVAAPAASILVSMRIFARRELPDHTAA